MAADSVEQYCFLWDGSEPGWVLLHVSRQSVKLSLVFGDTGPNLRELKAIRHVVPAYAAMPASETLAKLRGKTLIDIGEFESREAWSLAKTCRALGLAIEKQTTDLSGRIPFNENTQVCLVIEDDTFAKQICEEAVKRGVSVRYREA